jgi:hypothetical protein
LAFFADTLEWKKRKAAHQPWGGSALYTAVAPINAETSWKKESFLFGDFMV